MWRVNAPKQGNHPTVARALAPAGVRSAPEISYRGGSDGTQLPDYDRFARARTGRREQAPSPQQPARFTICWLALRLGLGQLGP